MRVLREMIAMTSFAALALVILQPAGAQQPPPRRDELQQMFERMVFRMLDTDNDGKVTKQNLS